MNLARGVGASGLACAFAAATLACAGVELPGQTRAGASGSELLTARVRTHCYGWPESQFSQANRANVGTWLKTGQPGADVTLRDLEGDPVTVASLLAAGKPVLLTTASVTCPVFQERHAPLQQTIRKYADHVTFATVYLIEAHPADPDPGPYKGRTSIHEFSDRRQAMTLQARIANARELPTVPGELVLVDDLSPGNENPFWCTYGTCANCAFLLDLEGSLVAVHEWYDPPSMEQSIDQLVGRR